MNENDPLIEEECFICLESCCDYDNTIPLKISEYTNIERSCNCNGYVHELCLVLWMVRSNSCPICREPARLIRNTNIRDPSGNLLIAYYKPPFVCKILYVLTAGTVFVCIILILVMYGYH